MATNRILYSIGGLASGLVVGWLTRPAIGVDVGMFGEVAAKPPLDIYVKSLLEQNPMDAPFMTPINEHLIIFAAIGLACGFALSLLAHRRQATSTPASTEEPPTAP